MGDDGPKAECRVCPRGLRCHDRRRTFVAIRDAFLKFVRGTSESPRQSWQFPCAKEQDDEEYYANDEPVRSKYSSEHQEPFGRSRKFYGKCRERAYPVTVRSGTPDGCGCHPSDVLPFRTTAFEHEWRRRMESVRPKKRCSLAVTASRLSCSCRWLDQVLRAV
jgi:hypothetical protein